MASHGVDLLVATLSFITIRGSVWSRGRALVLRPGLEEKLSSFGPHTLMGFRSLSKLSSAPKLAYASSIQRGPASFLFLSVVGVARCSEVFSIWRTPLTPRISPWWQEPVYFWDLVCPLAYVSYEVIWSTALSSSEGPVGLILSV